MRLLLLLLIPLLIISCTDVEIGKSKDVNPDTIFFDYRISGEESKNMMTCMLRYRYGGPNGTTLVLDSPAKVVVDGIVPKLDSAKYTGAYYELSKPIKEFAGHHQIVFIDINNKQYKEDFDFTPFSLSAELPEKVARQPFTIKLKDFPAEETPVRLVMTDTAFSTRDVNEIRKITNGEIPIDDKTLSQLKSGPVTLEIYLEDERSVKNGTKQGGRIFITYGLKREFVLVDLTPNPSPAKL